MRTKILLALLSSLMGLMQTGCISPKTGEDTVEVKTAGIFDPATFTIVGGNDLGEVLTGSEPVIVTLTVKNNSKFPITNLGLALIDSESSAMGMAFVAREEDGKTEFPGGGGTCSALSLASNATCTIKIAYNPARSGIFIQDMAFKYKNFVSAMSISEKMTVLTGEPASLVFPNEISVFNYGILEQTEPLVKTETLTIENRGGLSARNLDMSLMGNTSPSAFSLQEHNCPTNLKSGQNCQAVVSYVPLNNLETDPEKDYSGTLTVSYIKDGKTATGNLNSFYQFKSTKIQAIFEANQIYHQYTPDITVGNSESKNLKIINKGYKEGILQQLTFKTAADVLMATCKKQVLGDYLDCFDALNVPVTLTQFPFKIKDVSACLDAETPGIRGEVPGEACIFNLTFWPSVTFLTDRDFNGTKIDFKYDSRWKNNVTIINKNIYTVDANSLSAGKLLVEYMRFDGLVKTNLSVDPLVAFYDIGRIALITDPAYKTSFSIRFRNVGSSPVLFSSVMDGQTPGVSIGGSPLALPSRSDLGYTTMYDGVSTNCFILNANEFCDVVGNLIPLFYSNEALQDRLFLDVDPNGFKGPNRYKIFKVDYTDSTTVEDDGSARASRGIESRHTGVLVTKGMLVYQNPNPNAGNMGTYSAGNERLHKIVLKNVGTGTIPYLKIDDIKNLSYDTNYCYLFKVIADNPAPSTKDCVAITDFTNNQAYNPNPPPGNLAPGQTCALTVRAKIDPTERDANYSFFAPDEELRRANIVAYNNTPDTYDHVNCNSNDVATFQYYDGDALLGLVQPDYDNVLGFYKTMGDYSVQIDFDPLANMVPQLQFPVESAMIYRPAVTYPTIIDGARQKTGWIQPEYYFLRATATAPASPMNLSQTHVASLVLATDDFTIHAGTFPVTGETHTFSFSVKNWGDWNATVTGISFSPSVPEIAMAGGMPVVPFTLPKVGGTTTYTINFTPTAAGLFETDLLMTFNDGLKVVNSSFRIIAEAETTANSAHFTVTSENYDVTYDAMAVPTTAEVLSGVTAPVPLKTNNWDTGYTSLFEAVKGSAVYAKKRYYIYNDSAFALSNLSVFIKSNRTDLSSTNLASGYDLIYVQPTCANLAPLATCYFDIKFNAALGASATVFSLLHIGYALKPNQYISKVFQLQFNALAPAMVTVVGNSCSTVVSDGVTPWVTCPLYYGAFSTNPASSHIKQVAYPTLKSITVELANSSLLKASFLKQIEPGAVPAAPDNRVLIYNLNNKKVYAKRSCFYGDDETDPGVPASEKGFNSNLIITNKCTLEIEYVADETFSGTSIDTGANIIHLKYYNNKRASFDYIRFSINGFIEPNWSTSAAGFSNVSSVNMGATSTVSFNWGAFTGNTADWGAVTGYRVFMTQSPSTLVNLHTVSSGYTDVGAATTSITYPGLTNARYYYFVVAAKRTKNAKTYVSEYRALGALKLVTPPANTIYAHNIGNGTLFDKYYEPQLLAKGTASSFCGTKIYNLVDGGSPRNLTKALINTTLWNKIISDASYSNYDPLGVPHWLSDTATDIAPIFTPYGFDTTLTSDYKPAPNMGYMKSCSDTTCNALDKMVGSDGSDIPYGATIYIKFDQGAGMPRCWVGI